jgi:hypothetical protein
MELLQGILWKRTNFGIPNEINAVRAAKPIMGGASLEAAGGLAGALRQEYMAACEKAGIAPDAALLERVARALGGGVNGIQVQFNR